MVDLGYTIGEARAALHECFLELFNVLDFGLKEVDDLVEEH